MTVVGCLVTVIVSDLGKAICDFATATKRAPKTDEDLATVIYEDWAIPIVQEVILTVGQVNLTAYPVNLAADAIELGQRDQLSLTRAHGDAMLAARARTDVGVGEHDGVAGGGPRLRPVAVGVRLQRLRAVSLAGEVGANFGGAAQVYEDS